MTWTHVHTPSATVAKWQASRAKCTMDEVNVLHNNNEIHMDIQSISFFSTPA